MRWQVLASGKFTELHPTVGKIPRQGHRDLRVLSGQRFPEWRDHR